MAFLKDLALKVQSMIIFKYYFRQPVPLADIWFCSHYFFHHGYHTALYSSGYYYPTVNDIFYATDNIKCSYRGDRAWISFNSHFSSRAVS